MCGRLNQTSDLSWRDYIATIRIESRFNVAPTEELYLLREQRIELARWWLTPGWAKEVSNKYNMFNARAEKLGQSPAFRGPFQNQRGIVPMSSFIEWRKSGDSKQPWSIACESGTLYAAALWDVWNGGETPLLSCTIVTTEAPAAFQPWHNRMPVLLAENEIERWMDNSAPLAADDPIFRPELKYTWLVAPLDKAVGNARNKAPELMQPIGEVVVLE
ncbi:SOS response-associated peptidase [Haliea sp. E17]|uniref:SOS response-associated peptidase n=1 Tax=Haliea sp. E17 TaxID=3401576 RepID=UPI003AADE69C